MAEDLKLTGNELLVYAMIHGFSQDGNSVFSGSSAYISRMIGARDSSNVRKILKKLCNKGLIIRVEKLVNGVRLSDYKVNLSTLGENHPACEKNLPTLGENHPGVGGNSPKGWVKITHHNNIDNNIDNKKETTTNVVVVGETTTTEQTIEPEVVENEKVKKEKSSAQKERKIMKRPTVDEVRAKIIERGYSVDAEAFWNYYESNGWKVGKNPMKKWESALVTWQRKELNNRMNYGRNYENEQEQQRRRSVERRISELLHSAEEKMGFAGETSDAL